MEITGKKRILVIDDSKTVLQWARQVLEEAGFEVLTRDEPMQSTAFILREKPDLVLVDVLMPVLEGGDIIRSLRKSSMGREIRVLLHSSLPSDQLQTLADEVGADGYIPKTREPKDLLRLLRKYVGGPQAAKVAEAKGPLAEVPIVASRESVRRTINMGLYGLPDLRGRPMTNLAELEPWLNEMGTPQFTVLAPQPREEEEFRARIQALRARFPMPVLFIGHGNSIDTALQSNEAGATHYLSRPVKVSSLRAVIRELLQCQREQDDNEQRRRAPRLRIPVRVAFPGSPPVEAQSWDFNEYGVFVCTNHLRDAGSLVEISVTLPQTNQQVRLLSKVIHVRARAVDFYPQGMALSFDPSDEASKQQLARMLEIR